MNLLDENIPEDQRLRLRQKRFAVRQIGHDVGRKGMSDEEIIPLLLGLGRPTFFTRDGGFYRRELCHERYCVVCLDVRPAETAEYVRRLLRHPEFHTKAKRMGLIVSVSVQRLAVWRVNAQREAHLPWGD